MTTEGFKRKLTAILSADVKGYSRLMSQDERGTILTLTAYKKAMTILIQEYKGRVVDSPGDNLLAEFGSVVDAVNCAVEIQRELAERNTELPPARQMEFRIGINLGDVVEEEDRIYGDGVNIAARIEGLADGGGVCISGTAYDQVVNKLGLEYEFLGEQEVKNIERPVRVYRVLSFPGAAAHRVVRAKTATAKKWRKVVLAIAVILVIGAAVGAIWNLYFRPSVEPASVEKMAFPLPDRPSIAVLPFVNVGGDQEQEYFSDGMTDDLITDLSKISGLFVIARNSVFTYKGKPVKVQQVAQELGVRYVLEGSVRKVGDQVRMNAQLIDATTGYHLWAERYDGHIGDVFALQDKITGKIVSALAVQLTAGEQEQFVREETDNPAAYDAFLQGWDHYKRRMPDGYAKAVPYFEKAVALDPEYGRAYAALASTFWESWERGWHGSLGLSRSEARDSAKQLLKLAMDNPTPLAHQVASEMHRQQRKYDKAIAEAERAIALDPNDGSSHVAKAGALIVAGRATEAIGHVRTAMRLDPHYPAFYLYVLGVAHFGTGQFEKAAALLQRAVKRNPQNHALLIPLTAAYGHLGREQEAVAAVAQYVKLRGWSAPPSVQRIIAGWPYKDPKDRDRLADGLRKAGLPER